MNRLRITHGEMKFNAKRFLLAVGMSFLLVLGQTAPLLGNPTGGAVVAGGATIGGAGPTLTINQSTQNAIINWQQFSIAGGEATKFVVPNGSAATLNRVLGGNPSSIYGSLQSNGVLYLVNPSGIVVGPTGRIDTAGFLASTADISNQQFLQGGDLNLNGASAPISNAGTIHASMGDVYLIANQVSNTGAISAPHGTVGLAAGTDILFQQSGNTHLFVQATPAGAKRAVGVTNAGTISAAAAELKAAGGNAYALAINNTGVIAASGYKKINGQVYLTADGGSISNSGTISAHSAKGNGGTIVVDGTAVTSAISGVVTNSGTLNASATVAGGKGGSITLKNMGGKTVHSGKIVARGGQGGVGGRAEISGALLSFTGAVDLSAPNGQIGNLLLDPAALNVVTGGGSNLTASTVDPSAVVSALNGANVTLQATTSITVSNLINASANSSAGNLALNTPTLNLNAGIILQGGSLLSGTATTVNVGAGGTVQNAVDASSTASAPTLNLASGATYELTKEVLIGKSLTLNGNGAVLDGSNGAGVGNGVTRDMEIDGTSAGVTVNVNNVTLENGNGAGPGANDSGDGGGLLVYAESGNKATVTLSGCTLTGNTTYDPTYYGYDGGAIYNDGYNTGDAVLTLNNCTVTGNTGYYGGGVYNEGRYGTATLNIDLNSSVSGNTATSLSVEDDVYNDTGALNFVAAGSTTATLNSAIYNTGTGAVLTLDPTVTTITVNAPIATISGATASSSATTVNVGTPVGSNDGYLVQGGVSLAGNGGTVNLSAGTYELNGTIGEIVIGHSLTLNGNGAVLDGSNGAGAGNGVTRVMEIDGTSGGVTVNLNHLTLENGDAYGPGANDSGNGGGLVIYAESGKQATVTLTNCTFTGNTTYDPTYFGYNGGAIYNDGYSTGHAVLTLNNCTVTGNTGYYGGGIYNQGSSGSATLTITNSTITGNSGYNSGGIYNSGTITNAINQSAVSGNTVTDTNVTTVGADFYNIGTGTFEFGPDTVGGHTSTVNDSIYSSGANAVLTVDPSVTNLVINAPVTSTSSAVVNSSATTLTIGAGSGTENGYLIQSGLTLAGSGATVNLTAGTTYHLDGTTSGLTIGQSVTLNGNGATVTEQGNNVTLVNLDTGGQTITLNNLTLEDGGTGIDAYYYSSNQTSGVVLDLNNVTITGNTGTGLYDSSYYSTPNTVNLTNCTISNNSSYYSNAAGIYIGSGTLTLTNCTITGNGGTTSPPTAGAIYNSGTLDLDSSTTITGNTGNYTGGIYNSGTIVGTVNSSHVHGNTETNTNLTQSGADFYNTGTATFAYNPDGESNNTLTITQPIYSSGTGAVITVDPTIQTLDVNADIAIISSATFNSSATTVNVNAPVQTSSGVFNSAATTVNVAAGSGTENGYLVEGGVALAGNGATLNLTAGATYNFDGTTQGLSIAQNLTIAGNGATLNGQSNSLTMINLVTGANTVTLNHLTVENGDTGVQAYYYDNSSGVTLNLNNVTISGNSGTGLYDSNYYGSTDSVNLTNCTISGNDTYYGNAGGIYNGNADLTLTNCAISGNGNTTYAPTAGGIYNGGTLHLDSATTITGNIGDYTGGIDNYGTIVGTVNSSQVHGNTETYTNLTQAGADFYNTGTATFAYNPDGESNNTRTISQPIYSSGSGAVITIDSTIQTLDINADVNNTSGATFNSSATTVNVNAPVQTSEGVFNSAATTVNVAAGSGTENGYLVEGGVALASSGATVNLTAGTTYDFDGTTSGLSIGQSLTLAGHGATLNGQGNGVNVINLTAGANADTLNNLTVENGSTGIYSYYYNSASAISLSLNNVTITGNSSTGLYDASYYQYANAINLTNCTISNNSTYYGSSGGIYNGTGTMTLTNCTISGNGNTTYPPTAGGIENGGTLNFDSATTVTGNTGYYAGGIYNSGTIVGTVNSTQVHGNTETNTNLSQAGADFYNTGTATFVYKPDGEPNNTRTISQPIYSNGPGAVITIDPTIQTLTIDSDVNNTYSATFNSSATTVNVNAPVETTSGVFNSAATTVNVAAGSGTENGSLVQGGVALAGSGATVNLTAGTTYDFDGITSGLSLGRSLTLAGNGATLNAQASGENVVELVSGTNPVTLNINNLTVENGSTGIDLYYYNNTSAVAVNLNNVTITGNSGTGFYDLNYSSFTNTFDLTNCTISNNGAANGSGAGIYNATGALTLTNCTISNNGNATNAPTAGGIDNSGTLTLDSATTVTGNTGYYVGGIYNTGTIVGAVNSSKVHGNTATNGSLTQAATDFYNTGTATFAYNPDGEANNTLTITQPIYSSGAGAVITIDPTIHTLNINTDITSVSSAIFNSSAATVNINSPIQSGSGVFNSTATTVNVAAGSGTENGELVQGGVALAGPGATVNLAAGATYKFDASTGGLNVAQSVTLAGNGAVFNGQGASIDLINLADGANTVTLNNLTLENASTGLNLYYYNNNVAETVSLNNVAITGNTYVGVNEVNYSSVPNVVVLTDCSITNNSDSSGTAAGINNEGATMTLSGCTVSGNGSSTNPPSAGGIYNSGTLVLAAGTTITGNTGTYAGGLYNGGTCTVTDSSISGNTSASTPDTYNLGTYTFIADGNASTPNTINYATSDYNGGTATYQATTINWNVAFTNHGHLTIDPAVSGSVTINDPITNDSGLLLIQAPVITLNAAISSTYGNIVLADSSQFVNNVGAAALSATNGYTWQVWSANPPGSGQSPVDNDNGLVPNFIQYNATYGVTTAAGTGNGLLYSYAPVVNINLTGPYTKTYNGSPNLAFAANSYTTTGLVNGDSITTGALVGTFNTKDVNTANTVTVSSSTLLSSITHGNISIYGYTAGTGSAPGTITPATVTASLTGTVSKNYDTTTTATLTSANYGLLSGVLGGDSVSLNDPTTGAYASPNAGTNITVTVSGLQLLGTNAPDYTLASTTISAPIGTIMQAGVSPLLGFLTGTVSKVYNGTLTVNNLTSSNYALSGVQGNDVVVLSGPATGTYASPNVGSGIMVTSSTGLVLSGAQAGNYYLTNTQASGAIGIITPASLTVSTSPVTKTYDGTSSALGSAILTSGVLYTNVSTGVQDSLSGGTFTFTNPNVGTGDKTVTVSGVTVNDGNSGGNYTVTYASNTTSTINPATLSYTANPTSTVYGAGPSYLSGTITGFVNGQNQASATTGTVTFSTPATATSDVGSYPIDGSGLAADNGNYTIVQAASNATALTINPATLTYTANPVSSAYGSPPSGLSGTITGFVNNQTQSSATTGTVTFSSPATASSDVGSYAINGGGLTANHGDYTFIQAPANSTALTINPTSVVVTANDLTKTYGQTLAFTGTEFSATGLQNGQTIGSVTLTSAGAAATANVNGSPYTIAAANATGGTFNPNDYSISYQNGALTVNPATLTYVADTVTVPNGAPLPLSYYGTIAGLANNDSLTSVTSGSPVFTCTATGSNGPGYYAITGSGLTVTDSNYSDAILQGSGNATALLIQAPITQIAPTPISTTTGGADKAGSNIVPPVLTLAPVQFTQNSPLANTPTPAAPTKPAAPTDGGNLGDIAPVNQAPISFVGSGLSSQLGQQETGLANSSDNSGQVNSGDVAQMGNGQLNNVANPHAAGALNQALGPVVLHTLQDALQAAGDFADASDSGTDTDTTSTDATAPGAGGDETILSGGDVAEVAGGNAKRIPLSKAPPQLQKALAGDVLSGLGSTH